MPGAGLPAVVKATPWLPGEVAKKFSGSGALPAGKALRLKTAAAVLACAALAGDDVVASSGAVA